MVDRPDAKTEIRAYSKEVKEKTVFEEENIQKMAEFLIGIGDSLERLEKENAELRLKLSILQGQLASEATKDEKLTELLKSIREATLDNVIYTCLELTIHGVNKFPSEIESIVGDPLFKIGWNAVKKLLAEVFKESLKSGKPVVFLKDASPNLVVN